ncbi:MAG: HNH endonuclease [Pirellulales bacterium]
MARKKKRNSISNPRYRPKVPPAIKEALLREVGNQCANPGCPSGFLEFHHIDEWHVYQTHDQAAMIAVCPTCHGQVHRGNLRIDDATIRGWKRRQHQGAGGISILPRHRVYVAPAKQCSLLLGTLRFANASSNTPGLTMFELSPTNMLGFEISDREFLHLNLKIADARGNQILRVVDGNLTFAAQPPVAFEERQGKFRVRCPATEDYVPAWVLDRYTDSDEPLVRNGEITLVDIEVVERGIVRVQGVWFDDQRAVVIGLDHLALCRAPRAGFFFLCGYRERRGDLAGGAGEPSKVPIIGYEGPINYPILENAMGLGHQ